MSETSLLTTVMLAAAVIGGFVLLWMLVTWKNSAHSAAEAFSAFLTGGAILIAGYWYFVERRGNPHADVGQSITIVGEKKFAVIEVGITIKNLGATLLKPSKIDLRLQQVDPPDFDLATVAALSPTDWPTSFPDKRPMFADTEFQWRTIRYFAGNLSAEIEPGETDTLTATFIVPCTVKGFRIASDVKKADGGELWWKVRTFGSTVQACSTAAKRAE